MDKSQAIHDFWSSFGLTAYDENSVPDNAEFPYITYSLSTDSLGNMLTMTGSVWYRSSSWEQISKKVDQIAEHVGKYGFRTIKLNGGYVWITKGMPFSQRMSDENDKMIKRVYIILNAEFLTAY